MILSSESRIAAAIESGAWSRRTVDDLFKAAVEQAPEACAFADAGDPAVPGLGARYTYAEAQRRADGLAAFLAAVGLKPDTVVGIHLPPCADAALVILACLRAGLIVCPLPLHWTSREMETAIAVGGIKAIVTASEVEGDAAGERVRDVAAAVFAIRFVFAVGIGVPDGLMDLAEVMGAVDEFGAPPVVTRRGTPADHIAMVGFTRTASGALAAAPFCHAQIVAMAAAHAREAALPDGATVVSTLHPASLAGLVAGPLTAVSVKGTAAFHYGIAASRIAAAAETADCLVLPAGLGAPIAKRTPPSLGLSLLDTACDGRPAADLEAGRRVVDLFGFGGVTVLPRARLDGRSAALPYGPMRPAGAGDGPVYADLWIKGRVARDRRASEGELLLSGAFVPDTPWPEPISGASGSVIALTSDGALRTGRSARLAQGGTAVDLLGPLGEGLLIAGTMISAGELDGLVRAHPDVADAAVYAVRDDLLGSRIGIAVVPHAGRRVTLDVLSSYLEEAGASALVRPTAVITVPEIPRAADGSVMRKALFMAAVA